MQPTTPYGGWKWFLFSKLKYQCPNGYEFANKDFPHQYVTCLATRQWDVQQVDDCTRKFKNQK